MSKLIQMGGTSLNKNVIWKKPQIKMRLKNIEKESQQRQQVPGQVGNIKRHSREQNNATISGRNTAEIRTMGR